MSSSTFVAPFASYMKLGQGFNSYTQETCIEDAVTVSPRTDRSPTSSNVSSLLSGHPISTITRVNTALTSHETPKAGGFIPSSTCEVIPKDVPFSQIVSYSSRYVENMADIMDALNISTAASIKYGAVKGSGSAGFVDEHKVNDSDINYIISCRVTNETSTNPDDMVFNPIKSLEPGRFTEVYGDCFISGFLEGGQFDAIISIKAHDKSKLSAIKASTEASIQVAAVPGLSVETKTSMAKDKAQVFKDTETTISVNWSGGGQVKDPARRWDLETVIDVASRFPHLVQMEAQRTSAVLTSYSSLRSFVDVNSQQPEGQKYIIKNYSLCAIYTQDLFSAYMRFKSMWKELSEIMKNGHLYKPREKSEQCPDPIQVTPRSLNEARLQARKYMVVIAKETTRLIREPERADLDENGEVKEVPYEWPGVLQSRMPIKNPLIDPELGPNALNPSDLLIVGRLVSRPDIYLHHLSGDNVPPRTSSSAHGTPHQLTPSLAIHHDRDRYHKTKTFCTLSSSSMSAQYAANEAIDSITRLRIHAHEHRHFPSLATDFFSLEFQKHSKNSHGYISGLGFSSLSDTGTTSRADGTHTNIGHVTENQSYWSRLADLGSVRVAKIVVEYFPGTGRLAGLSLLGEKNEEFVAWKSYGQAKAARPQGLKVEEQVPPSGDGKGEAKDWALVGFWGHVDEIVISRIGGIWRRVIRE